MEQVIYRSEITGQIEKAIWAIEHIKSASTCTATYAAIQALLTTCANISKFFCPIDSGKAESRLGHIKSIFNIEPGRFEADFPILSDRKARDSFEHFDERIDYFVENAIKDGKNYVSENIGTICNEPGHPGGFYISNSVYMKHYDNINNDIYYVKRNSFDYNIVSVVALYEELITLKAIVELKC